MTDREFAYFRFFENVYVKPVQVDGATIYAVHAADGTLMCRMPDRETARLAADQFAVEALSVH